MFERPHSLIDEMIKEAMEQGKFENLPGRGKPLKLDEDAHVPIEQRLANKLLKDNDLAPDWIEEGKELREARENMIVRLRREVRRYHRALENAANTSSPELTRQALHRSWDVQQNTLRDDVEKLNRRLLGYNLKVPRGIPHLHLVNAAHELSSET